MIARPTGTARTIAGGAAIGALVLLPVAPYWLAVPMGAASAYVIVSGLVSWVREPGRTYDHAKMTRDLAVRTDAYRRLNTEYNRRYGTEPRDNT